MLWGAVGLKSGFDAEGPRARLGGSVAVISPEEAWGDRRKIASAAGESVEDRSL